MTNIEWPKNHPNCFHCNSWDVYRQQYSDTRYRGWKSKQEKPLDDTPDKLAGFADFRKCRECGAEWELVTTLVEFNIVCQPDKKKRKP